MEDIVILGAGGFAREVAFLIDEINRQEKRWRLLGFIDGDPARTGTFEGQRAILGSDDYLLTTQRPLAVALGIGTPAVSARVLRRLRECPHLTFPTLIHPSVIYDRETVTFGDGNLVCAGNILTCNISIGAFNILNLASTYGHDVSIGDFNVINPGVNMSGGVKLGNGCLIGTGATVLQYKNIGDDAVIGAAALVAKDVDPGTTVIGVPARPRTSPNAL